MQVLSRLESRFGLTRGDVTVTLFLVVTALAGFIYVTFLDTRRDRADRDLTLLFAHRDSVLAARAAREQALAHSLTDSAGAQPWTPVDADEERRDSVADERAASASRAGSGGKSLPAAPLNINRASVAELMRLPGIGEKTARAIVEVRAHVPFRRPEDLMNVKGIGRKKLEKIRPYVVVR
jgi:competence protein ComEA